MVGVTTALLRTFEAQKVTFSNGSRLVIRKVSYGRDNRFYHSPVRRVIASESHLDRGWRMVTRKIKSLRTMEVNSCWQSGSPTLVVFGEAIVPNEQTRVWEFRAVAANGEETEPLDCEAFDLNLRYGKGDPKSFRGIMGVGQNLKRNPVSVRIFEVGSEPGRRRQLAEIDVRTSR